MVEMKACNIVGVNEIPSHWEVKRTKYFVDSISKGNGITKDQIYENGDIQCVRYGEIYSCYDNSFEHTVSATNANEILNSRHIQYGDILCAGTGELVEEIGKNIVYLGDAPCLAGGDIIIIKHKQNPRFLNYALNCYYAQFQKSSGKTKLKAVHISGTDIGNLIIALPPKSEQEIIADYLDLRCESIDSLIKDLTAEIEVLDNYKRSFTYEVVTKGLNKDVPMKNSFMPWIGDVPKHWIIDKVKYHLKRFEPKNPGNQQVLSVYREYGVIPKDSRDDNYNITSDDTSKYKYVVPGNLVINKMKAWQGSMGVTDYEGIVSPAYFIYHFTDKEIIPKYIHYLFRSCYKNEFRRISGGIREGQWDLSPEAFNNTLILIPPVDEQVEIVNAIEKRITDIEMIIEVKKQQLDIIADYKKSLIYECVTGKKEVPAV